MLTMAVLLLWNMGLAALLAERVNKLQLEHISALLTQDRLGYFLHITLRTITDLATQPTPLATVLTGQNGDQSQILV